MNASATLASFCLIFHDFQFFCDEQLMFSDVISSLIPFEGALVIWKTLRKSTCYQQSLQIVSCEAPNFQKTTSSTAVICEWVNWRVECGATVLLEPHIRFEGLHETTLLGAVCLPLLHGELNQSSHPIW